MQRFLGSQFFLGLWIVMFSVPAMATSYIPQPWQIRALQADFIGVVECEMSGGLVAQFKVIEVWKSQEDTSSMRISLHRDYYGPQFPLVFSGDRFLVFAQKIDDDQQYVDFDIRLFTLPIWLRNQQADYRVSMGCKWRITDEDRPIFNSDSTTLEEFKLEMNAFLASPIEEQMLPIRKFNVKMFLPRKPPTTKEMDEATLYSDAYNQNELYLLHQRIDNTQSTAEIIDELIALDINGGRSHDLLFRVFEWYSYSKASYLLPMLKQADTSSSPLTQKMIEKVIISIEKKKAQPEEIHEPWKPKKLASSASAMEKYRKDFTGIYQDGEQADAFEMLSKLDPDIVSGMLCRYPLKTDSNTPAEKDNDRAGGYRLATAFAYYCKADRKGQFQKLFKEAKDPYVQTVGAVYLSFEDPESGMKALRHCATFSGDPGAWAALNLVRRGDKNSMLRALELFSGPYDTVTKHGMPHNNLRKRLAVLLSNSCKASKIPFPKAIQWDVWNIEVDYPQLVIWWGKNHDQITLYDPWFEELAAQKID